MIDIICDMTSILIAGSSVMLDRTSTIIMIFDQHFDRQDQCHNNDADFFETSFP